MSEKLKQSVPFVSWFMAMATVQMISCKFREIFEETMIISLAKPFAQYRFCAKSISLSLAFLITIFASVAIATVQPGYTGLGTSNIPFESLSFQPLSGADGPKRAVVFGNPDQGAHGFYLRLPPRWESPNHYHSANYNAVLIDGEVVNNYEGQTEEVRISKGGYFATVNNVNHITKCLSTTECIIYVQMDAAFDAPTAWQSGEIPR
jgi:beta-alanine degradation protein BauB